MAQWGHAGPGPCKMVTSATLADCGAWLFWACLFCSRMGAWPRFFLFMSFSVPPSPPSSSQPAHVRLVQWLRHFWPAPLGIDGRERLRFIAGAMVGVLLTAWLSRWWAGGGGSGPWMVASLGASAVLVFGMPSSPLAQPWPVLGGSTLSAVVGGLCSALIPDPVWAGGGGRGAGHCAHGAFALSAPAGWCHGAVCGADGR